MDDASSKALKRIPTPGIVNITVEGTFQTGGHFGQMDAYPNQFTARRVSHIAAVSKGMKALAEEQEAEKRWACGGSNSK